MEYLIEIIENAIESGKYTKPLTILDLRQIVRDAIDAEYKADEDFELEKRTNLDDLDNH